MKKTVWILVLALFFTAGLGQIQSACGEEVLITDPSALTGYWETYGPYDLLATGLIFTADQTAVMFDTLPALEEVTQENLCTSYGSYQLSSDGTLELNGKSYKVYAFPLDADGPTIANQMIGEDAIVLYEITADCPEGDWDSDNYFVPVSALPFLPTAQVLTGAYAWTEDTALTNYRFLPNGALSLYAVGNDDTPISEGTWLLRDDGVLSLMVNGVEYAYQAQYANISEEDVTDGVYSENPAAVHSTDMGVYFGEYEINLYDQYGETLTLWQRSF